MFCNLLFHLQLINDINTIECQCHRLVFELWLVKDMHYTTLFSKNVQAELEDKQVYDVVADNYGILWIIASEQLGSLRNTEIVTWCESGIT